MSDSVLTLADIERNDPDAPSGGVERRFLCPICGDGHKRDSAHRSLAVNIENGLWRCHRCESTGKLREYWKNEERDDYFRSRSRQTIYRERLHKFAAISSENRSEPSPEKERKWREMASESRPIKQTAGETYLASRGISADLAHRCGARFCQAWFGRSAVLFPIRNAKGALVAAQGRYLTSNSIPKALTGGPVGAGVFCADGRVGGPITVISEAPIDAMSLAAAGLPSVALCGKDLREWLARKCGLKTVYLALDADDAGDASAAKWAEQLNRYGATVFRLRPRGGCKDWNEALQTYGLDRFRAMLPTCLNPSEGGGKPLESTVLNLNDTLLAVYSAEKAGASIAVLSLLIERFVLTVRLLEVSENDSSESFSDPFTITEKLAELREYLQEKDLLIGSIARAFSE
jgi:hypothetical protein